MPFNDQNNYYGSPYSDPAIRFRTYHEMLRKIYENLELLKIIELNLVNIQDFVDLLEEVTQIKTDIEILRGILNIDSITPNTLGLGLKTFTVPTDLNFKPGQFILVSDKDNPTNNYMWGIVDNYVDDQLTIRSDDFNGSGTSSNWGFSLTGAKGIDGEVTTVVGTERNQYLNIGQFQDNSLKYFITTGSINEYILTPSPAITAYTEGQSFYVKANFTNTGPATINVNGLGTVNLTKSGSLPLEASDINLDSIYEIIFDGTQFQTKHIENNGGNTGIDPNPTFTTVDVTNKVTAPLVEATTNLFTPLIIDNNDNEALSFTYDTLPVNYLDIKNANTGTDPILSAKGDDANVSLGFSLEGLGSYNFYSTNVSGTKLKVFENTTNGNDYIQIKAPESITTSYDLTLPEADGSTGDVLQTDGSGNLSFSTLSTLGSSFVFANNVNVFSGVVNVPTTINLNGISGIGSERVLVLLSVTLTGGNSVLVASIDGFLEGGIRDEGSNLKGSGLNSLNQSGFLIALTDNLGNFDITSQIPSAGNNFSNVEINLIAYTKF